MFALANGHIGLRGNLDEGEPAGRPGTYLNGFYEQRPLPYAEVSYGNPEAGETVVNVRTARSFDCWWTTSRWMCAPASCATTSGCSTFARACCDGRANGCPPAAS